MKKLWWIYYKFKYKKIKYSLTKLLKLFDRRCILTIKNYSNFSVESCLLLKACVINLMKDVCNENVFKSPKNVSTKAQELIVIFHM